MSEELRFVLKVQDDGSAVIKNFTGKLDGLQKTTKTSGAGFTTWKSKLSGAATAVGGFKNKITGLMGPMAGLKALVLSMGIVKLGKEVVTAGAHFERMMTIVKGVSGATQAEFQAMGDRARELGRSTEWTAQEVAESFKFLSMAGLDAGQSLQAVESTLNLATAGSLELGEAADIATNIMTQMGLSAAELTRVNDALVVVQSSSNTTIREAAQAWIYAGTKAKSFGVEVEELGAMIGILADAGIKQTMAGTTLRQSMIKLLTPTKDAQAILNKYNIELVDGHGKLKKYTEIINDLSAANLDAIEVTEMFGARAGNIQIILDAGVGAVQRYTDAILAQSGASKKLADLMRNDMLGLWDKMKSAIADISLQLYDKLRPALEVIMVAFTKFVGENKGSVAAWGDFILATLDGILQAVGIVYDAWQGWKMIWNTLKIAWGTFQRTIILGQMKILEAIKWVKDALGMNTDGLGFAINELDKMQLEWNQTITASKEELINLSYQKSGIEKIREALSEAAAAQAAVKEEIKATEQALEEAKEVQLAVTNAVIAAKEDEYLNYVNMETMKFDLMERNAKGQLAWEDIKVQASLAAEGEILDMAYAVTDKKGKELVKQVADHDKAAKEEAKITKKTYEEMAKLTQDWREGVKYALLEIGNAHQTTFGEVCYNAVKSFYTNAQKGMSNLFFDAMKGDLKSFGDYFKSIWDDILRIFANAIAEMVAKWAASGLAQLFGGGGFGGFAIPSLGDIGGGIKDFFGLGAGTVAGGAGATTSGAGVAAGVGYVTPGGVVSVGTGAGLAPTIGAGYVTPGGVVSVGGSAPVVAGGATGALAGLGIGAGIFGGSILLNEAIAKWGYGGGSPDRERPPAEQQFIQAITSLSSYQSSPSQNIQRVMNDLSTNYAGYAQQGFEVLWPGTTDRREGSDYIADSIMEYASTGPGGQILKDEYLSSGDYYLQGSQYNAARNATTPVWYKVSGMTDYFNKGILPSISYLGSPDQARDKYDVIDDVLADRDRVRDEQIMRYASMGHTGRSFIMEDGPMNLQRGERLFSRSDNQMLIEAINKMSNGGSQQRGDVHVHVHIGEDEVGTATAKSLREGNTELIEAIREVVENGS